MKARTVTRVGAAHAIVLADIHAESFPPDERWDAQIIAGQLSQPGVFGFVYDDGGMVLARKAADEAEILTLAVAPSARRCGVGRTLMEEVVAEAARRGAAQVFLEVAVSNCAARALYDAIGFTQIGTRPAYYGEGVDALTLALQLRLT